MNISNPSLTINVAGIQNLRTAIWFGTLAPVLLSASGTPTLLTFTGAGQKFGGAGLITIANNQVVLNAAGIVQVVLLGQLSDLASLNSLLGIQFPSDAPNLMRASAPFVNGYATSLYNQPVNSGDTINVVGSAQKAAQQILGGTISVRLDLIA